MANERRVFTNLCGGLVEDNNALSAGGTGMTAAATTLTSAGLAAMPVVASTEHIVVVFDPDGLTGVPFAKRVTAHTAGASSATIETAALTLEGLGSARDVPRGATWVAAPLLKEDFSYQAYIPTFSQNGTRTTSALVARYHQLGSQVHYWGTATISDAGTAGNAIGVTVPLPGHASFGRTVGTGWVLDNGTASYFCIARMLDVNTLIFMDPNNTANENAIGVTPSFALASGDVIHWNVTYEAA